MTDGEFLDSEAVAAMIVAGCQRRGTNYDAVIESLETCCGPERPSRYPPVKAGHYLASRLQEVYGSLGPGEPPA